MVNDMPMKKFFRQACRKMADYFKRRKRTACNKRDKKCADFLRPFALEYQRSRPAAVEFVAVDGNGDEQFAISCDAEGETGPFCRKCVEKGEAGKELLNQIRKRPEEFLRIQGISVGTDMLQTVAAGEIRTIPSDTDYYNIPSCPYCGEILDMNCIPENTDEELTAYNRYNSLKLQNLRLLDFWYINRLLATAEKSKDKPVRILADKLAGRIIAENNL